MKKVSLLGLLVAIITGDDATAKSAKIQRKSDSILTAQVAVKNATTLELEEAVETAEENLNKAIVNGGSLIEYKDQYIRNIFEARDALEEATEALENHKKDIEFLKGIQSMWE
jgi:hypothetical protein